MSEVQYRDLSTARIAYTISGTGAPMLLVHGWPLTSATYRRLVPLLSHRFACCVPDLPPLGASVHKERRLPTLHSSARALLELVDALGWGRFSILAHDMGGTVARILAAEAKDRVDSLFLLDTEMPGHRPPFVPLYQRLLGAPGAGPAFRALLRSRTFLRSSAGFGGCFYDLDRIDDELIRLFVAPLIERSEAFRGVVDVLRGVDWRVIDALADIHAEITADVHLIWGEDDPIFPIERARSMLSQFPRTSGITPVPRARCFLQEERPAEVAKIVLKRSQADAS